MISLRPSTSTRALFHRLCLIASLAWMSTVLLSHPATAGNLIAWDFENTISNGGVSTSVGSPTSPYLSGIISQTGGGPAEDFGSDIVFLTRGFGTFFPYIELEVNDTVRVRSLTFWHAHNHNPGFPTEPSYFAQIQLLQGSDYIDIGEQVLLSPTTSGHTTSISVDLSLTPGTHKLRWMPRGLAYGNDTYIDYFALNDVVISSSPVPEPTSAILIALGLAIIPIMRRPACRSNYPIS